jgi:ornithine cyclodeaminase
MKVITVSDIAQLIKQHTFNQFIVDLMCYMRQDFSRWHDFDKSPRHAIHVPDGVIELMPIADKALYSFKYVNGHPKNPLLGKQTAIATGQLSSAVSGYPIMFSEMTTLTALRTAAATVLATDILARDNSHILAIIGTGAQSEFQVLAHQIIRPLTMVRFYDIDPAAMQKFAQNMHNAGLSLIACNNATEAINGADIVVVCTACKGHIDVVSSSSIQSGMHINALGGDCPGKTELELTLLPRTKIFVEYLPQSIIEGEIQRLSPAQRDRLVSAELYELINGSKIGRSAATDITLYDSVGFALEDYSALRLVYDLAATYQIGQELAIIPPIADPKNLISILQ